MAKHAKQKKKRTLLQRIYKCRRLIILIIIIVLIVILCTSKPFGNDSDEKTTVSSLEFSENDTQTSDTDEITIVGQTVTNIANGYTTLFTTLNTENQKTYIEYKQNLGTWSENSYWGGSMAENGCGITSISIIASGYGEVVTPEELRATYFPHLDADDMQSALEKLGIEATSFYFDTTYFSETYISEWLQTGRPILICVDNTQENIWTTASHYMALLDINNEGQIYVSNPNGLDDTEKASNWYAPEEILPYIAKAMFIESY